MEPRIIITPQIISGLVDGYCSLKRQEQRYVWEDAYTLMQEMGQSIVPGFTIDSENEFAYVNIAKWIVNDPTFQCDDYEGALRRVGDPCKGLYIQGPTGTGKSIAIKIARRVCTFLKTLVTTGQPQPLNWSSYNAEYICSKYEETGDLTEFKGNTIICIQDLGTEPGEVLHMGNRRNCIRTILEYRGDCLDKMTHVTSNIPINKTGEYYGERVKSRLYQMCNPITMRGADRRIK